MQEAALLITPPSVTVLGIQLAFVVQGDGDGDFKKGPRTGSALEFRIRFSDKNQLENHVLAIKRTERGLVNFPVILVTLRKGCIWKVVFECDCYQHQHQNHLSLTR